jgi:membrane protease YdiL (CAAX protease family)
MEDFKPVIKIAISAIKGAIVALIGLIILTTVTYGGPLILLYYWAYVVFYILPVALLIGAFFRLFSLFNKDLNSEEKHKRKPISRTSRLGIAFIFLLIFGFISVPYFNLNRNGQVEHGARWYINPDDEEQRTFEQNRSECDTQLVLFVLEDTIIMMSCVTMRY